MYIGCSAYSSKDGSVIVKIFCVVLVHLDLVLAEYSYPLPVAIAIAIAIPKPSKHAINFGFKRTAWLRGKRERCGNRAAHFHYLWRHSELEVDAISNQVLVRANNCYPLQHSTFFYLHHTQLPSMLLYLHPTQFNSTQLIIVVRCVCALRYLKR